MLSGIPELELEAEPVEADFAVDKGTILKMQVPRPSTCTQNFSTLNLSPVSKALRLLQLPESNL